MHALASMYECEIASIWARCMHDHSYSHAHQLSAKPLSVLPSSSCSSLAAISAGFRIAACVCVCVYWFACILCLHILSLVHFVRSLHVRILCRILDRFPFVGFAPFELSDLERFVNDHYFYQFTYTLQTHQLYTFYGYLYA